MAVTEANPPTENSGNGGSWALAGSIVKWGVVLWLGLGILDRIPVQDDFTVSVSLPSELEEQISTLVNRITAGYVSVTEAIEESELQNSDLVDFFSSLRDDSGGLRVSLSVVEFNQLSEMFQRLNAAFDSVDASMETYGFDRDAVDRVVYSLVGSIDELPSPPSR